MIPRTVRRSTNQRAEERVPADGQSAMLLFRGRRHVVQLVNTSRSGAMMVFPRLPHIGEAVRLRMRDSRDVPARVLWVRDGKVGVGFDAPLE